MRTIFTYSTAAAICLLLFSSTADARGKEKAFCTCGTAFIDAIAELSCIDSSMFSKASRKRGYFYASLDWASEGACGALISDGDTDASSCAVTQVGTIDGSGTCSHDGFAVTSDVATREEGRLCIRLLREIDRYLEGLPSCTP